MTWQARFMSTGSAACAGAVVVYSFYLLPALKIVYGGGMHERLGMLLTIALWLIFNYLAVLYIIWAFNRGIKSSINRSTALALPVMILVVLAILS